MPDPQNPLAAYFMTSSLEVEREFGVYKCYHLTRGNRSVHWYTTPLASLFLVASLCAHVVSLSNIDVDYASIILVGLLLLYFVMETILGVAMFFWFLLLWHCAQLVHGLLFEMWLSVATPVGESLVSFPVVIVGVKTIVFTKLAQPIRCPEIAGDLQDHQVGQVADVSETIAPLRYEYVGKSKLVVTIPRTRTLTHPRTHTHTHTHTHTRTLIDTYACTVGGDFGGGISPYLLASVTCLVIGVALVLAQVLIGHRRYEGHDNFANASQILVALAYFGPAFEGYLFEMMSPAIYAKIRTEAKLEARVALQRYRDETEEKQRSRQQSVADEGTVVGDTPSFGPNRYLLRLAKGSLS
eukprot:TRINITY_DN1317_c0_g1_i1.p1 TRINITY_DN1317_c0_g1~~TRINITY_DN1317_c0_g1_i1.p1  ORF type:complete len:354 (-),score=24.69 TRINITY_DN1317_c0_g1_i1:115-1176(-)